MKSPRITELSFQGRYFLPLSRENVWQGLNDPQILQRCIRHCERVERDAEGHFQAEFSLHLGRLKKSLYADLQVRADNPPQSYGLVYAMRAGWFGQIQGDATIRLLMPNPSAQTELSYAAQVRLSGWLLGLGVGALEGVAERYMQNFFATFAAVAGEGSG